MSWIRLLKCKIWTQKKIIEAMGYDQRIGNSHNNPSFGFGGYCLPKDIKQLEYHFKEIPAQLLPV